MVLGQCNQPPRGFEVFVPIRLQESMQGFQSLVERLPLVLFGKKRGYGSGRIHDGCWLGQGAFGTQNGVGNGQP